MSDATESLPLVKAIPTIVCRFIRNKADTWYLWQNVKTEMSGDNGLYKMLDNVLTSNTLDNRIIARSECGKRRCVHYVCKNHKRI